MTDRKTRRTRHSSTVSSRDSHLSTHLMIPCWARAPTKCFWLVLNDVIHTWLMCRVLHVMFWNCFAGLHLHRTVCHGRDDEAVAFGTRPAITTKSRISHEVNPRDVMLSSVLRVWCWNATACHVILCACSHFVQLSSFQSFFLLNVAFTSIFCRPKTFTEV